MNLTKLAYALLICWTTAGQVTASEGAAGPDQYVCGTSAVMAADPLVQGESGQWSVLAGTGVFADANSPGSPVTGLSPGENVFQWTVLGGGVPVIDQMIITVNDPTATVAHAGPDSVLCLPTDTMRLLAQPAVPPAVGSWSANGIALIDAPTDPHSAVEFPAGGTVQLFWTVYNGTCGQVTDTAIVTVTECIIGVEESWMASTPALLFDRSSGSILVKSAQAGARLDVIDAGGRAVMSVRLLGSVEQRISINSLSPGSYMVNVLCASRPQVLPIVIDR